MANLLINISKVKKLEENIPSHTEEKSQLITMLKIDIYHFQKLGVRPSVFIFFYYLFIHSGLFLLLFFAVAVVVFLYFSFIRLVTCSGFQHLYISNIYISMCICFNISLYFGTYVYLSMKVSLFSFSLGSHRCL